MAKNRRKGRERQTREEPSPPEGWVQHPAPKQEMRQLFRVFGEITKAGDLAISATRSPENPVVRLELAILLRALNALKGARILLEQAHWELAAGPTRQIFELLVNVEQLNGAVDRDSACFRYAKFGLLQRLLAEQAAIEYERDTGRSVDAAREARIEALINRGFAEFRTKKGWARSWSGKTIRQLAKESRRGLRLRQYELLFRAWSEEVHASPGALLESVMVTNGPGWLEERVADDLLQIAETAMIGMCLLFELWRELPNVAPLDPSRAERWISRLAAEAERVGAPPLSGGQAPTF